MVIDFSEYKDYEIKCMVKQCFTTIEKTGVFDLDSYTYRTWIKIYESQSYLNVSQFLNELYLEFAKRYNLCKTYREYLKTMLDSM